VGGARQVVSEVIAGKLSLQMLLVFMRWVIRVSLRSSSRFTLCFKNALVNKFRMDYLEK